MAKVKWRERDQKWEVRWTEKVVTIDQDGKKRTKYPDRRRSFPSKKAADQHAAEVVLLKAQGKNWTDSHTKAVATVGVTVRAYVKASKGKAKKTQLYRASTLQRWLNWAGEDRTVDTLTPGVLRDYAEHLRADGIRSVSRYVGVVEQWWSWVYNNREDHPGAPEPRRITGSDAEIEHAPAPVAIDTPTWADVDAMLHALTPEGAPSGGRGVGYRPQWELYRRIALVQRYSGLRISQVCGLTWADVDLERARLTLRRGKAGAKGQSKDRVVPMHPALVREMAGWGVRDGLVFSRVATKGKRKGQRVAIKGGEVAAVLGGNNKVDYRTQKRTHTAGAWERAGVHPDKWADAGDRVKKRATNAIRARFKSTIAGVFSYELATLMLGQSSRGDHDSYCAMGNPEASPYWASMVKALQEIPEVGAAREAQKVLTLAR